MPRKIKTTLTVLPRSSGRKRVPKPSVRPIASDPLSRRGAKQAVGINLPGVRTR